MFYFFSKTLNYLLTPAAWLVLALLLAFFTKNAVRRRWSLGMALSIFWVFGNSFLTNELALWWEVPPALVPTDSTLTTAVVLTGGMIDVMKEVPHQKGYKGRFLLNREADRAGQALYLYKIGVVQKILISGGMGDLPFQVRDLNDEGQMAAQFLIMAGVRPGDIILEKKSRNTHENAVFTAKMLHQRFRTNRCILVTSAPHMRRAVACFEKEGVVVVPFPGSFLATRRSFAPGVWLLPNEQAFADSYYLLKELVGYTVYKVLGYA